MTYRSFLTPVQLGELATKAERQAALWIGWASFLAEEATPPILSQLTDPQQGKLKQDDILLVGAVYNCLHEASGADPTQDKTWPEALEAYNYRRRIKPVTAQTASETIEF